MDNRILKVKDLSFFTLGCLSLLFTSTTRYKKKEHYRFSSKEIYFKFIFNDYNFNHYNSL